MRRWLNRLSVQLRTLPGKLQSSMRLMPPQLAVKRSNLKVTCVRCWLVSHAIGHSMRASWRDYWRNYRALHSCETAADRCL